jgi:hypothetical protein
MTRADLSAGVQYNYKAMINLDKRLKYTYEDP